MLCCIEMVVKVSLVLRTGMILLGMVVFDDIIAKSIGLFLDAVLG